MSNNKVSTTMASKPEPNQEEFDWITLRKDMGATETTKEKLQRKMRSNPLVPIGCLFTAGALTLGLISFRKGDRVTSQKMMRLRVLAQGLTVAALMGGMVMAAKTTTVP